MPKTDTQILEYDGEPFFTWCHKCWRVAEKLIVVDGDVRTACCRWLIGKAMDEDYKKMVMENQTLQ